MLLPACDSRRGSAWLWGLVGLILAVLVLAFVGSAMGKTKMQDQQEHEKAKRAKARLIESGRQAAIRDGRDRDQVSADPVPPPTSQPVVQAEDAAAIAGVLGPVAIMGLLALLAFLWVLMPLMIYQQGATLRRMERQLASIDTRLASQFAKQTRGDPEV